MLVSVEAVFKFLCSDLSGFCFWCYVVKWQPLWFNFTAIIILRDLKFFNGQFIYYFFADLSNNNALCLKQINKSYLSCSFIIK